MNEISQRRVIIVDNILRTALGEKQAFLQTRENLSTKRNEAIDECTQVLLNKIKAEFSNDVDIKNYLVEHPNSSFILEAGQYTSQVFKAVTTSFDRFQKKQYNPFKDCTIV